MKIISLVYIFFIINSSFCEAQLEGQTHVNFVGIGSDKYPIIFLDEHISFSCDVVNNGKNVLILPDEISVNGISGGSEEFGYIKKTGFIYTYSPPKVQPRNYLISLSISLNKGKSGKFTKVQNIMVLSRSWEFVKEETTVYKCGQGAYAYTLKAREYAVFEINKDLSITTLNRNKPMPPDEVSDVKPCIINGVPACESVIITPGKGEIVKITAGRISTTNGELCFKFKGTVQTSNPGFHVVGIGGRVEVDSKPDDETTEAPFVTTSLCLKYLTYDEISFGKKGWQDASKPNGTNTFQTSYVMKLFAVGYKMMNSED
jgi:hypothetical protein